MIPPVTRHARQRAVERLGRDLTDAEWLALVAAIVARTAVLLAVHPNGSETWAVAMGDATVRVVWAPKDAVIVTLPPPESAANDPRVQSEKERRMRAAIVAPQHYRGGQIRRARTIWR